MNWIDKRLRRATLRTLFRARVLLTDPGLWHPEDDASFKNYSGKIVRTSASDPRAKFWSIHGALIRVANFDKEIGYRQVEAAISVLLRFAPDEKLRDLLDHETAVMQMELNKWERHPNTTKEDVLRIFDRSINFIIEDME